MGTFPDGETLDITDYVTWASATPSVATISGTGVASALAPGTTTITASLEGVTSPDDTVTVLALLSIAVTPGNPELAEGVAGQFTATGTYSDGSTANITSLVTWASATPSVATISGTGLATALVPGTSAITASMAGVTSPGDTLTVIAPSFVVNTTADDFGFYTGTTSLREAIASANAVPGQTITFDPTVFATPQTITLSRQPARAERHDRDRDDHGPGGGRDGQRQRREPGVPGRLGCHGVHLGTDDHRRQRQRGNGWAAACSTTARPR